MKRVEFISRWMAEDMIPYEHQKASIISINSDNKLATLADTWLHKHYVVFEDIDAPVTYKGRELLFFNEEQARSIIDFVEAIADETDNMFVHCDAGVSRSAAVAKYIADVYGLHFNDQYSIYNRHVYSTLWKVKNNY